MFKNFISFLKARKAMRLMDRAMKLRDDLLNFIKEEPASITLLAILPIYASFTTVMAAVDDMLSKEKEEIDALKKENEEKKEE